MLHCFVDAGPLGEQGVAKKDLKVAVLMALNAYVLVDAPTPPDASRGGGTSAFHSNFMQPNLTATIKLLESLVDSSRLESLREVWIRGNSNGTIGTNGTNGTNGIIGTISTARNPWAALSNGPSGIPVIEIINSNLIVSCVWLIVEVLDTTDTSPIQC